MAEIEKQKQAPMDLEVLTENNLSQLLDNIHKLEAGLLDKINGLLKPVTECFDQLKINIQQVAKTAERAKAMSPAGRYKSPGG